MGLKKLFILAAGIAIFGNCSPAHAAESELSPEEAARILTGRLNCAIDYANCVIDGGRATCDARLWDCLEALTGRKSFVGPPSTVGGPTYLGPLDGQQ